MKRVALAVIGLLSLLCHAAQAQDLPARGNGGRVGRTARTAPVATSLAPQTPADNSRWALVIGINDYLHAGHLKYCRQDAQQLADVLRKEAGFGRVVVLTDDAEDQKDRPTIGNLRFALKQFTELPQQDDTLLVFFAGHGVTIGGTHYLLPVDGERDPNMAVSLDWVKASLNDCKATTKLLILDTCRPGTTRAARSIVPDVTADGGVVVMASCSTGQDSHEEDGHGVFTGFLVQGLRGAADADEDSSISQSELFSYVSSEMLDWSLEMRKMQVPRMFPEDARGVVVTGRSLSPRSQDTGRQDIRLVPSSPEGRRGPGLARRGVREAIAARANSLLFCDRVTYKSQPHFTALALHTPDKMVLLGDVKTVQSSRVSGPEGSGDQLTLVELLDSGGQSLYRFPFLSDTGGEQFAKAMKYLSGADRSDAVAAELIGEGIECYATGDVAAARLKDLLATTSPESCRNPMVGADGMDWEIPNAAQPSRHMDYGEIEGVMYVEVAHKPEHGEAPTPLRRGCFVEKQGEEGFFGFFFPSKADALAARNAFECLRDAAKYGDLRAKELEAIRSRLRETFPAARFSP